MHALSNLHYRLSFELRIRAANRAQLMVWGALPVITQSPLGTAQSPRSRLCMWRSNCQECTSPLVPPGPEVPYSPIHPLVPRGLSPALDATGSAPADNDLAPCGCARRAPAPEPPFTGPYGSCYPGPHTYAAQPLCTARPLCVINFQHLLLPTSSPNARPIAGVRPQAWGRSARSVHADHRFPSLVRYCLSS